MALGANGSGLGFSSAYRGALDTLSGGRSDDVETLVRSLAPAPREISGAELALQFFSNMAANASQPGSTLLSSAASAVKPTADEYIRQVEANRKDQAALGPLAISLAKSLKPSSTQSVPRRYEINNIVKFKELFPDSFVEETDGKYYTSMNSNSFNSVYGAAPGILSLSEPKGADDGDKDKTIEVLDLTRKDDTSTPNYDERIIQIKESEYDSTKHGLLSGYTKPKSDDKDKTIEVLDLTRKDDTSTPNYDERIIQIKESEYDSTKHGLLSGYTKPKSVDKPKLNTFERLTNNVFSIADKFEANPTYVPTSNEISTARSAYLKALDPQEIKVTDKNTGDVTTFRTEGVDLKKIVTDVYGDIIAESIFGKVVKDAEVVVEGGGVVEGGELNQSGIKQQFNLPSIAGFDSGLKYSLVGTDTLKLSSADSSFLANNAGAIKEIESLMSIYFPNGEFDSKVAKLAAASPEILSGVLSNVLGLEEARDARRINTKLERSIEVILRMRSGAAVPPEEVKKYMDMFRPNFWDRPLEAAEKLKALSDYFVESYNNFARGRIKPTIGTDGNKKYIDSVHGFGATDWKKLKLPNAAGSEWNVSNSKNDSPSASTTKRLSDGRIMIQLDNGEWVIQKK